MSSLIARSYRSMRGVCSLCSGRRSSPKFIERGHRKYGNENAIADRCSYSTEIKPAPPRPNYLNVFDRQAKLLQRKRAAHQNSQPNEPTGIYDYIKDEVCEFECEFKKVL